MCSASSSCRRRAMSPFHQQQAIFEFKTQQMEHTQYVISEYQELQKKHANTLQQLDEVTKLNTRLQNENDEFKQQQQQQITLLEYRIKEYEEQNEQLRNQYDELSKANEEGGESSEKCTKDHRSKRKKKRSRNGNQTRGEKDWYRGEPKRNEKDNIFVRHLFVLDAREASKKDEKDGAKQA